MVRRSFYYIFIAYFLLIAHTSTAMADSNSYLEHIASEALDFLQKELGRQSPADKLEIKLNNIDSRLNLHPCDNDLTYQLHSKPGIARSASNVTLKVSCNSSTLNNWSFYISARVDRYRSVAVARQNLPRGAIIDRDDITADIRLIPNAGSALYSTPEAALGMAVKRPVREGDIIRSSSLTAPLAVKRGDQVKIRARKDGVSITTSGVAMTKGRVGEQILVKNLHSERIIKARISATGQVDVLL